MTATCSVNNFARSVPYVMKSLTTHLSTAHSTAYSRVPLARLAQIIYKMMTEANLLVDDQNLATQFLFSFLDFLSLPLD